MLFFIVICYPLASIAHPSFCTVGSDSLFTTEGVIATAFESSYGIVDSLPQMPGWPKYIGVHGYGATLADINGDGNLEILVGTEESRSFYVWDYNGNILQGWPKTGLDLIGSKPAVGDLDPSYPGMEIVVQGGTNTLYAWHYDGTNLNGWPQSPATTGKFKSPTFFDLDNDGDLEIIFCLWDAVWVFNHDGSVFPGWPQFVDQVGTATSSVADVDNDEIVEICAQSYRSLYLWDKDGNLKPGWPIISLDRMSDIAQPTLADLDNDGDLEIIHTYYYGPPIFKNFIGIYHHDGSSLINWPQEFPGAQTYTTPVVADIDNDSDLEIFGGGHCAAPIPCLLARHHTGDTVVGWPVIVGAMECSPIVFDLDLNDNNQREILINDNSGPAHMYAYNDDGTLVPGWPINSGCSFPNSPSVGDVDADGDIEIAFVAGGYVNLWTVSDVQFLPYLCEWGTWFHDNWNTGWFHPKAPNNLNATCTPLWIFLTWDANTELDIAGYNVYRSETSGGPYGKINGSPLINNYYYDVPPLDTTPYFYCVTAQIKAGVESRLSNEVTGYLGVAEYTTGSILEVVVFPNPFVKKVNFIIHPHNIKRIKVYNSIGVIVHEVNEISDKHSIEWQPYKSMTSGVYFVEFETETNKITKKIIKIN